MAKQEKLNTKNWYSNKYQIAIVQRNVLFLFAIISMIAVTVSVFFVKQMTYSKSLEPYVIEINEKTGIPTVVDQVSAEKITANKALIRYFLYEYVKSVEGYDPYTYQYDYEKAALFSTPKVFRQIRNKISNRSESSPASILGQKGRIGVQIKSIQFFDPPTRVQVRIKTKMSGKYNPRIKPERDLLIDMQYKFANLNLSLEKRYINPLGFQVTFYRVTEEIQR